MSTPGTEGPHEGRSHLDPQSETVHAPVPDESPPRRSARPVFFTATTVIALVALAVALVVAAFLAA